MARTVLSVIVIFVVTSALLSAGETLLWRIGTVDGDYAEFLRPKSWDSDLLFTVGRDDPASAWPYIHPATADNWAGNRVHTFRIRFDLERTFAHYQLRLHTVAAHGRVPPLIKMLVNDELFEIQTEKGPGDVVLSNAAAGRPETHRLIFNRKVLRPGGNTITIRGEAGSWFLYDAVELAGYDVLPVPDDFVVTTQPCWYRHASGASRGLRLDFGNAFLDRPFTVEVYARGRTTSRDFGPGARPVTTAELQVPMEFFDDPIPARITVRGRNFELSKTVAIEPVRLWEVHLVHQTHLDIGYTHTQEEVLRIQLEHLEKALEYIERSKEYPEEARFIWHPEGMWAVEEFMETASDEKKAAFLDACRRGRIHIDSLYAQAMTGMYSEEELFELIGAAKRFEKEYGVEVTSAMQSDVPGYTWGLVAALAHQGVHSISVGPNPSHRVGHTYNWGDKPFWWVSPSGRHKVLFWMSSRGYAMFHGQPVGHRIQEGTILEFLDSLIRKGYPYEMVLLRYNIGADNGPPNPALCDVVKAWNEKFLYPRLVIARNSEFLEEFGERYGDDLPIVSGDFTPYWEDGCASTAKFTGVNRSACELLVQAQSLWAMLSPRKPLHERFDDAWCDLIMYDEHTWGAWNSISDPDNPFVQQQEDYKKRFALRGESEADKLLAEALDGRQKAGASTVDVYNTLSWDRSGLVLLDPEQSAAGDVIEDHRGRVCSSQRLATGELAFLASSIPAFGAARFSLNAGSAPRRGSAGAEGSRLWNDNVRIEIDTATGAIESLQIAGLERDFVDPEVGAGLNDYLYILGRDETKGFARITGGVTVTVEDVGPLVATLRIDSAAPGCRSLTRRIRLVDGSSRIELINTADKRMVRRPEGVYFGFPFNIPGGRSRIDVPWAVVRPEIDQIDGANRNYYCVQRWVDISNENCGVTWVTLDAPMMQFDPIKIAGASGLKWWRTSIDPGSYIHSWVMNNHWETNYAAFQTGAITFRYVLVPHRSGYDPTFAQRAGREAHQPLFGVPSNPAMPTSAALLRLEGGDGVMVTSIRPSRDSRSLMVRLFNVADFPESVTLHWGVPVVAGWISNPMEARIRKLEGGIELGRFEILTLRIDR